MCVWLIRKIYGPSPSPRGAPIGHPTVIIQTVNARKWSRYWSVPSRESVRESSAARGVRGLPAVTYRRRHATTRPHGTNTNRGSRLRLAPARQRPVHRHPVPRRPGCREWSVGSPPPDACHTCVHTLARPVRCAKSSQVKSSQVTSRHVKSRQVTSMLTQHAVPQADQHARPHAGAMHASSGSSFWLASNGALMAPRMLAGG